MLEFSREGILGCVLRALIEAELEVPMQREQVEAVVEYMAGELDTTTNSSAEKALREFYSDF